MIARLRAFNAQELSFVREVASSLPTIRNLAFQFWEWPSSYWEIGDVSSDESEIRRVTKLSDSEGLKLVEVMQQV